MQIQIVTSDDLMMVKLIGEVTAAEWQDGFLEVKARYEELGCGQLLLDGTMLTAFNVSHLECQELGRGFAKFAAKTAFFSEDPLIFGMMRIIYGYSDNDALDVCKSSEQAKNFLSSHCVYQP